MYYNIINPLICQNYKPCTRFYCILTESVDLQDHIFFKLTRLKYIGTSLEDVNY